MCTKGVVSRSKAIDCDVCEKWTHVRCSKSISILEYDIAVANNGTLNYICDGCAMSQLPFDNQEEQDAVNSSDATNTLHYEEDNFDCFKRKGLHCIHINARSMLPKLSELRILAAKSKAAVIAVSETWLDETVTDQEVSIHGYVVTRRDRLRSGGGVCLYTRTDLAFNPRQDLEKEGLEAVWLEVLLPKTKPILIGACYQGSQV